MGKPLAVAGTVIVAAVIAAVLWPHSPIRGQGGFFADKSYNFETLRVLNDIAVAGGDTSDVLTTVGSIRSGNANDWYTAWTAAGDRAAALASRTQDSRSKGTALLRAHTYYRSAEFFLPPTDLRRAASFKSNVDAFYRGLEDLKVPYERIAVPYGKYQLNAVYYPGPTGAETRPLLVVVGGYDSTMEELYLLVGSAAAQHGYSVLTYEGPGQGSVLRQQGLQMQANWEEPNSAVLNQFLSAHPKPRKIVLLGASLGGYLAPRAAAFDPRVDGVVAFDAWFDGYAIATRNVPPPVLWLHAHGYDQLLDSIGRRNPDPGTKWAQDNGTWVFGVGGLSELLDAFKAYSIAPVAVRITQDVLLLAGTDDLFVPVGQLDQERNALTHAHSVTAILFDRDSGGSLHCQIAAPSLWQGVLFDWLVAKFPDEPGNSVQY
jgi:alpha-beta hydrolase superfamily lysophospholipase